MSDRPFNRDAMVDYFLESATPREAWKVGMEIEKLGRSADDGQPLPYEGSSPSVRDVIEFIRQRCGGTAVIEGDRPVGVDASWGGISLEPGGQVEWSSRPAADLDELRDGLDQHLATMAEAASELGVRWLSEALDPELPVEAMPWMPKARYGIMRPYMGRQGDLAHRMMTQTASIQVAYDFADAEDWRRKFRAAALLSPVGIALFANSRRVDGRDSGYACYRQVIWTRTDPDRCGLPDVVFEPGFDISRWAAWVLDVPTMFRHRARGLVPSGGVPFSKLMQRTGCDALRPEDWETHLSGIFTDVRSYNYIEVRSADLQPDDAAIQVPAFWLGILYDDDALDGALELGAPFDSPAGWRAAMDEAARRGLDAEIDGRPLRQIAAEALRLSRRALAAGAPCAGDPSRATAYVDALAERHHLSLGG